MKEDLDEDYSDSDSAFISNSASCKMYQSRKHAFGIVTSDPIQHGLKCDGLLLVLEVY